MYINITKVMSLGQIPAGYLTSISNLFFNDALFRESSLIYDFVETWFEVEQLNIPAFSSTAAFVTEDDGTTYVLTAFESKEDCIAAVRSPEFNKFTEVKIKLFEVCEWLEFPRRILPENTLISSVTIDNVEEFWKSSTEPDWDKS
jgi:hypothetical protein